MEKLVVGALLPSPLSKHILNRINTNIGEAEDKIPYVDDAFQNIFKTFHTLGLKKDKSTEYVIGWKSQVFIKCF